MKLIEEYIKLLEAIYYKQDLAQLRRQFDWTHDQLRYYAEELQKDDYISIYEEIGGSHYRLTPKGKVAIKSPDKINDDSSIGMNSINITGSINAPISFLQNSDQNTVNITQNINQNITETLKSIDCLSQYIKKFPENKREIANVHLEDLKQEVEKHEQSKPQKIRAYFMAFIGIALPLLSCVANTTDFLNNVTDLASKFSIELPEIPKIQGQ
jgi:DNA-binding PadR family transcriptional regulator